MTQEHTEAERRARFEAIAAEVVEPVRRFLARRTDAATADDALADTLLVCWRRLDEIPEPALPWVYGVARLSLANALRSVRRQQRLAAKITTLDPPREAHPDGTDGGTDAGDARERRVHDALAAMRTEDAELLRLWAWEQLGPGEIATALDITTNAASIRLHRAREKFKEQLRKIDAASGHEEAREGRRP